MFNQYIIIPIWVGFMALIQGNFYQEEYEELTGEWDWRVKKSYAFIAFLPIIWYAGHRGWDGHFDTGLYIRSFWDMPTQFSGLSAYLSTQTKDKGFYWLSAVIKILFGADEDRYFTIIALIQGVCVFTFFRRYTREYILAVFLFVASTDYISWMFNGIRQFTAVALLYAAAPFLIKKKYVPMILCALLASQIHGSAIIIIPIMFIVQGKAWNNKTLLMILGVIIAVTFVGSFTSFLDGALQDTQYANVVSDYQGWNDTGTNPLRVLVYSLPAIMSFMLKNQIRSDDNVLINICTNMSIMSAGLYILSMFTSGIFMGRLPIYCSLYSYIILPWEIEQLFGYEKKRNMMMVVIGFYLLFYFYIMRYQYGII